MPVERLVSSFSVSLDSSKLCTDFTRILYVLSCLNAPNSSFDNTGIILISLVTPVGTTNLAGVTIMPNFFGSPILENSTKCSSFIPGGATALVLDPETTATPGTSAKPSYSPILTLNAIRTSITVVVLLISLAIVLIFVKRFLEACYAQQPNALPTHSVVYVFFYARGRFAMSQLFIFPDDINTVRVCQRDEFKLPTINVTNCGAIYTATFDWNFLDIRREDGKRIYLPPKTTFSSLTTRHLNNTLRDPCEVKMVANYNHCFFDLFTWRRPEAIPTTTISSSINPAFRLDDEDWERMAKTARVV